MRACVLLPALILTANSSIAQDGDVGVRDDDLLSDGSRGELLKNQQTMLKEKVRPSEGGVIAADDATPQHVRYQR